MAQRKIELTIVDIRWQKWIIGNYKHTQTYMCVLLSFILKLYINAILQMHHKCMINDVS